MRGVAALLTAAALLASCASVRSAVTAKAEPAPAPIDESCAVYGAILSGLVSRGGRVISVMDDGSKPRLLADVSHLPALLVADTTVRWSSPPVDIVADEPLVFASVAEYQAFADKRRAVIDAGTVAGARDGGFGAVLDDLPFLREQFPLLDADLEAALLEVSSHERPLACDWPARVVPYGPEDAEAVRSLRQEYHGRWGEPLVYAPSRIAFSDVAFSSDHQRALVWRSDVFGGYGRIGYLMLTKHNGRWLQAGDATQWFVN